MSDLIAAVTQNVMPYPGYVNITRCASGVVITVRSDKQRDEYACGKSVTITLCEDDWRELREQIIAAR